jgi:TolB protein
VNNTMKRRSALGLALLTGTLVLVLLPPLSEAAPSARNGEIAFSASVHGISQVFTVKPDGTRLREITHSRWTVGQNGLSWSPTGRGLLYTASYPSGRDAMIKSRADGDSASYISPSCTGDCLGDDNPVYSPDGKKIAFERAFGPIVNGIASVVAIFTINADGSHLTQLTQKSTPTSTEDHQPQWSPDGRKIAFYRLNTTATPRNKGAIEVMNADGSSLHRLTPYRIDAADPHWSPNGKHILFNTYANPIPGRSANLFTMRANGAHRLPLTHYTGGTLQAFADDWSPDGTQILYRRLKFSGTDTQIGGFYILTLRNGHTRRLTPLSIRDDTQPLGAGNRASRPLGNGRCPKDPYSTALRSIRGSGTSTRTSVL